MVERVGDEVRRIARAVLYEGYLLWPYRQSALKNQRRWLLGGVYPEPFAREHPGDLWQTQTQCLIEAGPDDTVDVGVRFLHVVQRDLARRLDGGGLEPVPELIVDGQPHLPREEAIEREVTAAGLVLDELARSPYRQDTTVPAGRETEWLTDAAGGRVGAAVATWEALGCRLDVSAERLAPRLYRLTAVVSNTTPWSGGTRAEVAKRTLVSAHVVLYSAGGRFVSLIDPPDELREHAERCRNIGLWPVLAGAEGDRSTMLSAPIILYDHPKVAPESPGDLFDATEIDKLLTLSILALSDEEHREIRAGDPRAREILDRCTSLTPEQLMRLHGVFRDVRAAGPGR